MPIGLPTGSVRPEVAQATLDLIRGIPALHGPAVAAYQRLLNVGNVMLRYAADAMSQQIIRDQIATQERIIAGVLGNYVNRPYEYLQRGAILGVDLRGVPLSEYYAGRFTEDQLRAMVYGAVLTHHSATPQQRDTALRSLRDLAGYHVDQIITRWGTALGLTGTQLQTLAQTGQLPAAAAPAPTAPGQAAPSGGGAALPGPSTALVPTSLLPFGLPASTGPPSASSNGLVMAGLALLGLLLLA